MTTNSLSRPREKKSIEANSVMSRTTFNYAFGEIITARNCPVWNM